MTHLIREFVRDEKGQSMTEDALFATFLTVIGVALCAAAGTSIHGMWAGTSESLDLARATFL
ncbi:MAG TPA: hypothetical protein VMH81_37310 [Bryobacteraceae bacterium]|nr:hypothetical protein [Bryobacteraceae bacterium]